MKPKMFDVDRDFEQAAKDSHSAVAESIDCENDNFNERRTSSHAEIENRLSVLSDVRQLLSDTVSEYCAG
jgi:hypothetical protein